MPGPRNMPARGSQRRNTQQDDTPTRTRSGRGGKSSAAAKVDKLDVIAPKSSPTSSTGFSITRKATRSASNVSNHHADAAPEIYASYEEPLFMVFGLPPEFFDGLKKHHGKLPKTRKFITIPESAQPPSPSPLEEESEDETTEESDDDDEPILAQASSRGGRGRGGRGSRGGRGRGGRGRGRGGRARGGLTRTVSPLRTRPARNAAPMFPLTEDDAEDPSNQTTPIEDAKHSPQPDEEMSGAEMDHSDHEMEDYDDDDAEIRSYTGSYTPVGSPAPGLFESILDGSFKPAPGPTSTLRTPKISLHLNSASQTPLEGPSPPAEVPVPKLLDPADDLLSDSDLPDPWIEDAPVPLEDQCEDRADYLLRTRFKPMTDVQDIIAALTKFPANQRSTESLYALAENTQIILKAWQDEYLTLDARTAPHAHPPKKPCNGGRIPILEQTYEDMKESELYGYIFDPKKPPGCQDAFAQRPGAEKSGGRELRQRRARDMLDSAAPSEEDEEEDGEGRPAKRQRRATRKFDGSDQGTGTNTPKKHNGWGGARKKGVSKYAQPASETPEPEARGKRTRGAPSSLLHQRIQEMREESAVTSSGDEGSSAMDVDDTQSQPSHKRGRPAGSKNVGRRSDYGVKKGPRKRPSEASTPAPSAHAPNAPPPALQSMSEGQSQFSIDPQPSTNTSPHLGSNSVETVFQATPQPAAAPDPTLIQPSKASTPDTYMNTAPLSQYSNSYAEDSSGTAAAASGSRRKPRVKSEKRSQSMTIWWAERKARQKELEEKNGTPTKSLASRSNSSAGKRGSKAAAVATTPSSTPSEPQSRASLSRTEPGFYPSEAPPPLTSGPPPSVPSGPPPAHLTYASAPPPLMMQHSPLAALPSGPPPAYSAPTTPNSQFGPRALAPAPVPAQQPANYPSPYGPRTAPRPKSSGPPPLAPAPPPHISPYPPVSTGREMPFKVMIPGLPPSEARRGSR